jgi:hypothetical protein
MTDPARLSDLMMGEHQCLVAQVEYPDTPIHNDATPFTSDKLAQRNLVVSAVANPGLDASRMALHTFEIEATPEAIGDGLPPDELLLDWLSEPPEGTEVRLHMPGWNAEAVVAAGRSLLRLSRDPRARRAHGRAARRRHSLRAHSPEHPARDRRDHRRPSARRHTRPAFRPRRAAGEQPQPPGVYPAAQGQKISKEEAAKLLQGSRPRLRSAAASRACAAAAARGPSAPKPGVYDLGNNRS